MNRRQFLEMLGLGAATLAAPKFIFDVGANLWKQEPKLLYTEQFLNNLFKKEWQEAFERSLLHESYWPRFRMGGSLLVTTIPE